jgi:hypothetical protein
LGLVVLAVELRETRLVVALGVFEGQATVYFV